MGGGRDTALGSRTHENPRLVTKSFFPTTAQAQQDDEPNGDSDTAPAMTGGSDRRRGEGGCNRADNKQQATARDGGHPLRRKPALFLFPDLAGHRVECGDEEVSASFSCVQLLN